MSAAVWPPIDDKHLADEQAASQARELEWLLVQLRDTLQSLKAGLEECAALLAPSENGSTLVLSSVRSENLKGLITRIGTRITKGNVKLRLASLPPPRPSPTYDLVISSAPQAPTLVVPQLTSVRTSINSCLDAIDVATWGGGDATNGNYVAGQLQLLHEHILEARQALKGSPDTQLPWNEEPVDDKIFDPPLPPNVSFHLFVYDAALVLEVRTLEPYVPEQKSLTGFSIRDSLASALGGARAPTHDEADLAFKYKGQDVRVKEKVRVETQDPSLISASAKLNALEHSVKLSRKALNIVMDRDEQLD